MAILHLVRCDSCASDTPMDVHHAQAILLSGQPVPQMGPSSVSVPSKIKQVDGRYFCSWECVGAYAGKQAKG